MSVSYFFLIVQLLSGALVDGYGSKGKVCVYHVSPSEGCHRDGGGSQLTSTTVPPAWLQTAGIDDLEWDTEASVRRVALNGGGITGAQSVAAVVIGGFGRFGNILSVKDLGVTRGQPFLLDTETIRDDAFFILSYGQGECLQIAEAGEEVVLGPCGMDRWNGRFVALHTTGMGKAAFLVFAHSGRCMSTEGGSRDAGARLTERPCILNDPSQMWSVVSLGKDVSNIVNMATGMALTVGSSHHYGNSSARVIVVPRGHEYAIRQAWSPWAEYLSTMGLTGGISRGYKELPSYLPTPFVGSIIQVGMGRILSPVGNLGTTNNVAYYAISPRLSTEEGSAFRLEYLENGGGIQLQGVQSGKCWNVPGPHINDELHISACDPSASNQQIFIVQGEGGYFYLIIARTGLCLGSLDDEDTVGNKIVQSECKVNSPHQLWQFEEASTGSEQFYIHQRASNLVVDVEARGRKNGTFCILWERHAEEDFPLNQLFTPLTPNIRNY